MIIPVLHRILVKPNKLEEEDKSYKSAIGAGIIIPELDQRKREQAAVDRGIVVQVGDTAFTDFGAVSPVKAGDYIAYAKHAGKYVRDPETEEDFLILNDEDIVCILISKKESTDE